MLPRRVDCNDSEPGSRFSSRPRLWRGGTCQCPLTVPFNCVDPGEVRRCFRDGVDIVIAPPLPALLHGRETQRAGGPQKRGLAQCTPDTVLAYHTAGWRPIHSGKCRPGNGETPGGGTHAGEAREAGHPSMWIGFPPQNFFLEEPCTPGPCTAGL